MNEEKIEFLICQCEDPSHQMIMSYWPEDIEPKSDPVVTCEILLNPNHSLLKRIWIAIQYIFKKRSKFGMFDEILLMPEDYEKLMNAGKYLKKCCDFKKKEETFSLDGAKIS